MSRVALCLLSIALAAPAAAQTGQAGATMAVTVEVLPNCTVAAAPLELGVRRGGTGQAAADIAIVCGPDEPFTIALDRGTHASGALRRAYDPLADRYVAYDIFRDPGHSLRWGDGPGEVASGMTNASGQASLKAYGRVLPDQDQRAGRYADQVVVTVSF